MIIEQKEHFPRTKGYSSNLKLSTICPPEYKRKNPFSEFLPYGKGEFNFKKKTIRNSMNFSVTR